MSWPENHLGAVGDSTVVFTSEVLGRRITRARSAGGNAGTPWMTGHGKPAAQRCSRTHGGADARASAKIYVDLRPITVRGRECG